MPTRSEGPVPTLGIEEEYLLLDPGTGQPAPLAQAVRSAAALQPALGPDDVQGELLQVQVEVATPVCHELDEATGTCCGCGTSSAAPRPPRARGSWRSGPRPGTTTRRR